MNAQNGATTGDMFEGRGWSWYRVGDSIIAALCGFVASICALCVADTYFAGLKDAIGIVAVQTIFNAFGCLVGWLVFLLPAAILYGRSVVTGHTIPICVMGVTVGAILTGLESWLLGARPIGLMNFIYVPFGAVDAAVATATMIYLLRRKSSQQLNEGV
jgi:hypothetical protein